MEAPSADMKAGKLDEILNCFVTMNFHHILRQSYHYDHCQHICSHLLIEITETINNCLQIQKYSWIHTAYVGSLVTMLILHDDEVPKRPNMWYIFEKRIVQGYRKLYSHMPNAQIQKYKYTNTQIHKYSI